MCVSVSVCVLFEKKERVNDMFRWGLEGGCARVCSLEMVELEVEYL